jgi:hypothetical protein
VQQHDRITATGLDVGHRSAEHVDVLLRKREVLRSASDPQGRRRADRPTRGVVGELNTAVLDWGFWLAHLLDIAGVFGVTVIAVVAYQRGTITAEHVKRTAEAAIALALADGSDTSQQSINPVREWKI